jgi:hypothetical protein
MDNQGKDKTEIFTIIQVILGVPLALILLIFGIANLVHPDVPVSYLKRNNAVCIMVIVASLIMLYAMFRPYVGGIIILIYSAAFFMIIPGNPLVYPIILIGVLSIIRGFLHKQKLSKKTNEISILERREL